MAGVNRTRQWVVLAAAAAAPALAFAQTDEPAKVDAAEKKLVGAEGLLARGQFDLASQEFNEFLKQYPADNRLSRARFGRALAANGLNDPATALTALESVATDKSFNRREEALALLATVYLNQYRPDRALDTLDTLLKELPQRHANRNRHRQPRPGPLPPQPLRRFPRRRPRFSQSPSPILPQSLRPLRHGPRPARPRR